MDAHVPVTELRRDCAEPLLERGSALVEGECDTGDEENRCGNREAPHTA
ncbi:MAG TPA: hypothetical protein VFA56_01300 [Gaiellaceae bacterium]|nr:hypothetical protein [Gaiellaceae bacterium]